MADHGADASDEGSEPEAAAELMVTTRARRANAGNRMSTLIAKSAEEEDEWGEEWEEAPNEEEFQGGDVNEQEDYNMDSSSSDEDDGGDEDEAGEKELRKAERQEKTKKRKAVTNPFAARVAAVARKKAKVDLPAAQSPMQAPPRPKKKSERASWYPTEEDGPVRASSRQQTVANKEATLSKLMDKDRRRDDTLAMMKAAAARKEKDAPKPLSQAERLAEAARNEKVNKKTLHRWEEAEESRAAERQAKIDAFKNRQMEGPFVRFYSGPAIWVDDKLKYTGKDAPTLAVVEEQANKVPSAPSHTEAEAQRPGGTPGLKGGETPAGPPVNGSGTVHMQPSPAQSYTPTSVSVSQTPPQPPQPPQQPWSAASQGGDIFMGSHGISYPSSIMFAPPSQGSFLYGIDQYAQVPPQPQSTPTDLPPNPFTQASPYNPSYPTTASYHSPTDPLLSHHDPATGHQALLSQFQRQPLPPPAPEPPRKKTIQRAMRNLIILSSFPNLELPPTRRATKSLIKDEDRAALIQLSATLFHWSTSDATAFISTFLAAHVKGAKKPKIDVEAVLKPVKPLCAVTNAVARYRDPETGIAYRDARAFGVLRGVVGGGFVWSGDLGCYVGGRAKPLESMGGKGFLGMPPAKGVPRRFLEMQTRMAPPPVVPTPESARVEDRALSGDGLSGEVDVGTRHVEGNVQHGPAAVKMEHVATT